MKGLTAELSGFLTFGRGLDTSRMKSVLGFRPAYTTESAFADFGHSISPGLLPRSAAAEPAAPVLAPAAGSGGGHA